MHKSKWDLGSCWKMLRIIHFSPVPTGKGFDVALMCSAATSESLIFIDDVSPAASGGYCDYEDLDLWGEGPHREHQWDVLRVGCGVWGVGVLWLKAWRGAHYPLGNEWLTITPVRHDSLKALDCSNPTYTYQQLNSHELQTKGRQLFERGSLLEAFLQNCVVLLHVDESSFTCIYFAAAFISSDLQMRKNACYRKGNNNVSSARILLNFSHKAV